MNKTKWFLVAILLLFLSPFRVYAQQACQQQDPCLGIPDLSQRATCYSNVVDACRSQGETLSSQIDSLNNRIRYISLQIENTKAVINKLSNEINDLNDEITRLEGVLTTRSELILRRIPESYKRATISQFGLLFFSSNFSDFITRLKYLVSVEQEDAALLFQVKATQNNYSARKQVREEKKQQQEAAQAELEQQNADLTEQKQEKNTLLAETQGSEETYSQLLAQARAQLAAFSGFVQGQGGLTLINADPSWPSNYFSQRDNRWGGINIAGFYSSTSYITSIGQSGCLISSVAMVLSKRGNSTTPLAIGTNGSYFFNAYFLWSGLTSLGFSSPMRTLDRSVIDNALSNGKWVIVGLDYSANTSLDPFHFVVITSKNGSDYNLFDPWRGPNISFNSNYGGDYITEVITY